MHINRRKFGAAALGGAALALSGSASAQSYPSKPVKILVGAGPGGTADLYARIIAQELTKSLGQPFVVENKAGASSTIAAATVAQSPPDGYTLLLGASNTHAINPHLIKTAYDHVKSFSAITLFATGPLLLMVNPTKLPVKSVAELIDVLKKNPNKYSFGSTSIGTGQHMAGELFKLTTQTAITHVPYRTGSGEMLNALMVGDIQFAFDNITSALPQHNGGTLRAIAVSSLERTPALPDIPAVAETLPGFEVVGWHCVLAPGKTPKEIVDKLNSEIKKAVAIPEINKRVRELGGNPIASLPAELDQHIALETEKYGKLIKDANIKME
jgi:tripartite-type tricarboxylate transporter receptor subunit TctC